MTMTSITLLLASAILWTALPFAAAFSVLPSNGILVKSLGQQQYQTKNGKLVQLAMSTESSADTVAKTPKQKLGSVVTIECDMAAEGDFVPEPLIDTTGTLSFVLGGGNYLPGLHDLVADMEVGDTVKDVSLDAGWGSRNPNLVAVVQKKDMGDQIDVDALKVGVELALVNGMRAAVTEVTGE